MLWKLTKATSPFYYQLSKGHKLIALYRKEFEKLPELKAKIRATAFNDHEALDDAQKVSAF